MAEKEKKESKKAEKDPEADAPSSEDEVAESESDAAESESKGGDFSIRALICHLLALIGAIGWFLGFVVPGLLVIGPFIAWLAWRDSDSEVDRHGREAINYNLFCSIVSVPVALLAIPYVFLGWVGAAVWLGFLAFACIQLVQENQWRYPLPFRFV